MACLCKNTDSAILFTLSDDSIYSKYSGRAFETKFEWDENKQAEKNKNKIVAFLF